MAWAVAVRLILAAILPSYLLLLLRPTVKVCVVILEQELSDRQTVDASATNQKDCRDQRCQRKRDNSKLCTCNIDVLDSPISLRRAR
jgi:hypothetical protein